MITNITLVIYGFLIAVVGFVARCWFVTVDSHINKTDSRLDELRNEFLGAYRQIGELSEGIEFIKSELCYIRQRIDKLSNN